MNLLVWRLHRNQVALALTALVAIAVLFILTGTVMRNDYTSALRSCTQTQSCADLASSLFRGDGAIIDLVDLTVVTVALPYLFSACAQLTYLVSRRRRVQGWLLARDLTVAGVSVLFSMWVTFASGYSAVYQALVLVLVGVVLYAFLNARRQRLGEAPEPADLPAGHQAGD